MYVVAWLAFKSRWAITYAVVAFGVSKLSISVFVYFLVAVRALHVISPKVVMCPSSSVVAFCS